MKVHKTFRYTVKGSICVLLLCIFINGSLAYTSSPDKDRIEEAKEYSAKHGFNESIICFCDFSRHSGTPRFWVYDCDHNKVLSRSICPHGCGEGNTKRNAQFSNRPGSNCSSLGFYRICEFHKMKSGLRSLRLKGLESSNSNALFRGILIHGNILATYFRWGFWPVRHPLSKMISQGCFAINGHVLTSLISMSEESSKPILLYAYDDNR